MLSHEVGRKFFLSWKLWTCFSQQDMVLWIPGAWNNFILFLCGVDIPCQIDPVPLSNRPWYSKGVPGSYKPNSCCWHQLCNCLLICRIHPLPHGQDWEEKQMGPYAVVYHSQSHVVSLYTPGPLWQYCWCPHGRMAGDNSVQAKKVYRVFPQHPKTKPLWQATNHLKTAS